eukprot:scaffold441159_cov48-Prasinocladus_malaysianus.AAC.1
MKISYGAALAEDALATARGGGSHWRAVVAEVGAGDGGGHGLSPRTDRALSAHALGGVGALHAHGVGNCGSHRVCLAELDVESKRVWRNSSRSAVVR